MENKTLTAVEYFNDEILIHLNFDQRLYLKDIFKKAKEMEKEQIIDAFVECWKTNVPDGIECKLDAEQYYNETYKSK